MTFHRRERWSSTGRSGRVPPSTAPHDVERGAQQEDRADGHERPEERLLIDPPRSRCRSARHAGRSGRGTAARRAAARRGRGTRAWSPARGSRATRLSPPGASRARPDADRGRSQTEAGEPVQRERPVTGRRGGRPTTRWARATSAAPARASRADRSVEVRRLAGSRRRPLRRQRPPELHDPLRREHLGRTGLRALERGVASPGARVSCVRPLSIGPTSSPRGSSSTRWAHASAAGPT